MREEITIGARWALTIILLLVVWFHSHWSVALAITGLSIANEIESLRNT